MIQMQWLTDDTGESPVTDSPTLQRETLKLRTCYLKIVIFYLDEKQNTWLNDSERGKKIISIIIIQFIV